MARQKEVTSERWAVMESGGNERCVEVTLVRWETTGGFKQG